MRKDAPRELRREKQRARLCDRQRGLSEVDADKRLNSQMGMEDRLAKAKGSFCGDGSREHVGVLNKDSDMLT